MGIGILAFTLQIFGDFAGYSSIARGLARLMGFELMVNFRLPYFAVNPSDFWNRWHISLSTWLRDYLYIPLGGNRHGTFNTYRNLMLTMLLGGLWHGAAWNFVIWGGYHGAILILYRLFERQPMHQNPWSGDYPKLIVFLKILLMFCLTMIGWLFFRAGSLEQISYMLRNLGFATSEATRMMGINLLALWLPVLILQIIQYRSGNLLIFTHWRLWQRILLYCLLLVLMAIFSVRETTEFIYFQF